MKDESVTFACRHCRLVQYLTSKNKCRRCKETLYVESPKPAVKPPVDQDEEIVALHVAVSSSIRNRRRARGLSQRGLGLIMKVPRTYVSKVENGKALPTLTSLHRFARGLNVTIYELLKDVETPHAAA